MTIDHIAEILAKEAEYAEAHKDAPVKDGTIITHRGQRSHVFSIRLSDSERVALEHAAEKAGVAPSTLARQWIAERLASGATPVDIAGVADTLDALAVSLRAAQIRGATGPVAHRS
jgi:hypothetical protein